MSEPARPNIDEENDRPMPASGPFSVFLRFSNTVLDWPEDTSSALMASPIEVTVVSRPQKVPSSPRKISSPTR